MDRSLAGALLAAALLASCGVQPYRAAPLAPESSASAFASRNLSDPGLKAYEAAHLGAAAAPWPPASWNLRTLDLAALYFNPQLAEARAQVAESQAQLTTAGVRPNPTLGITPGIPSPYLLTLDLSFPIETAGKRRYRVESARNSLRASELDLAAAAWNIRVGVRAALVDYLIDAKNLELLRAEADIREKQMRLLDRMSALGEIPGLEADNARMEHSRARAALGAGEQQSLQAAAQLAAAIGIPASALEGVSISWPQLETPPAIESLQTAKIRREAVLNRLSLRSALARYAAAESHLQLEIARQYPDIDLGPGYTYEERQSYFTLGFASVVPVLDRNRGPIAEAHAQREQAAAAFLTLQTQVIQKSESSLELYAAALQQLALAEHLAELADGRRRAMGAAVRAGEQISLELDDAEIEYSAAARARLEALGHAQRALGELEDAVERPLAAEEEFGSAPSIVRLGSTAN